MGISPCIVTSLNNILCNIKLTKVSFYSSFLWYFTISCYFTIFINNSDEKQGMNGNVLILVTELDVIEGVYIKSNKRIKTILVKDIILTVLNIMCDEMGVELCKM